MDLYFKKKEQLSSSQKIDPVNIDCEIEKKRSCSPVVARSASVAPERGKIAYIKDLEEQKKDIEHIKKSVSKVEQDLSALCASINNIRDEMEKFSKCLEATKVQELKLTLNDSIKKINDSMKNLVDKLVEQTDKVSTIESKMTEFESLL